LGNVNLIKIKLYEINLIRIKLYENIKLKYIIRVAYLYECEVSFDELSEAVSDFVFVYGDEDFVSLFSIIRLALVVVMIEDSVLNLFSLLRRFPYQNHDKLVVFVDRHIR
jgi:hypothetical protein